MSIVHVWILVWTAAISLKWGTWGPKPPGPVKRVVSLAPSITELVFALGAGEKVVGVTRYDTEPAAVTSLPKVGGLMDPDPEAILALHPDVVLAVPTGSGRQRIDTLARLGLAVWVLPAESLEDLWAAMAVLGQLLDRASAASALKKQMQAQMHTLKQRYQTSGQPRRRVLLVVGRRPLVAAGAGSFLDSVLDLVGAQNVVRRGGAFPVLDLEAVVRLDPDVIVDVSLGTPQRSQDFWSRVPYLRAAQNHRVVSLENSPLIRPGPHLIEGLTLLAQRLQAL